MDDCVAAQPVLRRHFRGPEILPAETALKLRTGRWPDFADSSRLDNRHGFPDTTPMDNVRLRSRASVALLLLLALAACGRSQRGSPTDGQVVGAQYTNWFFGFALTLPPAWSIAPKEVLEQFQQTSHPKPTGVNPGKTLEKKRAGSQQDSLPLLFVSEKPWRTATDANPSLIVGAEKLSHL